jgi:hypothetical protein
LLRLKFKHTFDLFSPGHDATFENVSFILLRSLRVDYFFVGEGKQSPALAQADEDIGLGNKIVKPFHEIFGDEVGPALLVVGVLHNWSKHLIADGVHMLEDVFGDLKEDNIVFEGLFRELVSAYPQNDEA